MSLGGWSKGGRLWPVHIVFIIINAELAQDLEDTQFGLSLLCNNTLQMSVAWQITTIYYFSSFWGLGGLHWRLSCWMCHLVSAVVVQRLKWAGIPRVAHSDLWSLGRGSGETWTQQVWLGQVGLSVHAVQQLFYSKQPLCVVSLAGLPKWQLWDLKSAEIEASMVL